MADLVIKIREYIGESCWNWYTDEYEWATNCADLQLAVEYAGYAGQAFDRIVLEIGNCYGGYVDEGLAMFHYLQGLDVPVHTRILGTVASMGTIIPLAGDTIEATPTSQWMVHAPSNEFGGTAAKIRASLKGLDGDTSVLAAIYAARTGADEATIAQWMSQDTWFTAAEALAAGLCTQVTPLRPKTAPAAAPTEAQARQYRQRVAQAVARADKRTPSPAQTPAAPAPIPVVMTKVAKPIAAAVKPTPRAAAKPAPVAKPAQARKGIIQQLKELFAGLDEAEAADNSDEAGTEAAADVQSTELDNGAFLYHEGPLAQGSELKQIKNSFMPDLVITLVGEKYNDIADENWTPDKSKDETEADRPYVKSPDRLAVEATIRALKGAATEASVMLNTVQTKDEMPQLDWVDKGPNSKCLTDMTARIEGKVYRRFGVPPVLDGVAQPGQLGTNQQIVNSIQLFNLVVKPARTLITGPLQHLRPDLDFTVKPLNPVQYLDPAVAAKLTTDELRAIGDYPPLAEVANDTPPTPAPKPAAQ